MSAGETKLKRAWAPQKDRGKGPMHGSTMDAMEGLEMSYFACYEM